MSDYLLVSESARFLQNGMAGRNILTVLYLVILTLCFVTPIFYYFRLHCQDQQLRARNRRLEEAYVADIVQASVEEQSETRAMRKKYRAERRARIIQLFAPVSMVSLYDVCVKKNVSVFFTLGATNRSGCFAPCNHKILRQEHFHPAQDEKKETVKNLGEDKKQEIDETPGDSRKDNDVVAMEEAKSPPKATDADDGLMNSDVDSGEEESPHDFIDFDDPYAEETNFVKIPSTGVNADPLSHSGTRLVPCVCVICLGQYEVGEEIVWSSNPLCEHAFHEGCIERWLMKQRGGPLCPCCRRDFIIDPFDVEGEEENVTSSVAEIQIRVV